MSQLPLTQVKSIQQNLSLKLALQELTNVWQVWNKRKQNRNKVNLKRVVSSFLVLPYSQFLPRFRVPCGLLPRTVEITGRIIYLEVIREMPERIGRLFYRIYYAHSFSINAMLFRCIPSHATPVILVRPHSRLSTDINNDTLQRGCSYLITRLHLCEYILSFFIALRS